MESFDLRGSAFIGDVDVIAKYIGEHGMYDKTRTLLYNTANHSRSLSRDRLYECESKLSLFKGYHHGAILLYKEKYGNLNKLPANAKEDLDSLKESMSDYERDIKKCRARMSGCYEVERVMAYCQ